jgi:CBS domain-containing protein
MRVKDIMTKQVTSCGPDDTLDRAAQLMWDKDCGLLPICARDGINRVVGVITDRDICMSALFQGKALSELRVADAMARQVQVCRPGDTFADAEESLRTLQLRRLPVVDDAGALVGIITLADLAREAARERKTKVKDITEAEVGDTLARVCQPAGVHLVS